MTKPLLYNQKLSRKENLKTQSVVLNKNIRNFRINNGVIFLDGINNSKKNNSSLQYETKEERTYWFHKYLQDLQNRGNSQKILRLF